MTPDRLAQITQQLAEQLYIDAGRGTPLTVPWDSPRLPSPTRQAYERHAHDSVRILHQLGLLREA